jgi:hypothetical protein
MDIQQLISNATDAANGGSVGGLLSGFSFAWLFAGFLFGMVGLAAFGYGKKNAKYKPIVIGIILMVYPYFIKNTIILYLVGIVLTMLLFVLRD